MPSNKTLLYSQRHSVDFPFFNNMTPILTYLNFISLGSYKVPSEVIVTGHTQ